MRAMAGTIARHTSIRQCVSLAIVVFTIASVFVLKYLDYEGQWSQLQRMEGQWSQLQRMDPAGNNHSSAGGIVKSQASVQSQHGPSVNGRWRIEDAAVQFRPEELGFSSSEIIRSNYTPGVPEPAEAVRQEVQSRIAILLKSRNPCRRSNGTRLGLACLPYFYLVGFPKCGTTDLYWRLGQHPDIVRSQFKEMNSGTNGSLIRSVHEELHRYEESFGQALLRRWTSGRDMLNVIIGDRSPSAMWDNTHWRQLPGNANRSQPRVIAADVVRDLTPDARIVVIVRNPADRLYSEYMFFHQNASKEAFHDLAMKGTRQASDCFKQNTVRRCVYHALNKTTLRAHVGVYHVYIEDWLRRFPREQLHVLRLEDLAANRTRELARLCAFLGVDHLDEKILGAMVEGPVVKRGQMSRRLGPMLKETRDILNEFYRPFNKRLAEVLKDEKYDWV